VVVCARIHSLGEASGWEWRSRTANGILTFGNFKRSSADSYCRLTVTFNEPLRALLSYSSREQAETGRWNPVGSVRRHGSLDSEGAFFRDFQREKGIVPA